MQITLSLLFLFQGDLTNAQWSERSQEVNFANVRFLISEHRLKHGVEEKLTLEQEENEEKGKCYD